MRLIAESFILLLLLLGSGFFSGAETAIFSLTKIERGRIQHKYPYLSRWVHSHLEHPRRTLLSILIGNLLIQVLATAIVTFLAFNIWGASSIAVALVIYTFLIIVFGEIIPKSLAVKYNEIFVVAVAIPLRIFSLLILPVRWLTQKVTSWLLSLILPQRKEMSDEMSEGELKAMLKIGEEEGVLDSQESHMIEKLMELGERQVKDIMTPRVDLAALDVEDPREVHVEIIRKFHFTHFPVYQGSADNILGVVSSQDYMLNPELPLPELLQQAFFIPKSKRIRDLLTDFKESSQNFAVCVDEYGGTAGIVTLEDILEEIFGEFYDEYAKVENPVRPFGFHEYLVDAKITLADFNEYFSTQLEAEEASTLGGYILEKLGDVPVKGQVLSTPECDLQIDEVLRKRRIRRVIVRIRL